MKEKRKGPISRAAGLAENMAATVRRMQREREPRVLVYDPTGYARLVQPEARGQSRVMEIAEAMVALASEGESRRGSRGEEQTADDPATDARPADADADAEPAEEPG